MMNFRVLLIILFLSSAVSAQSTYTKWALEAGGGIHGSSSPFTAGYSQEDISLPQLFVGGRYMFNEKVGLRATLGYLSMSEAEESESFSSSYYRASLEAMLDLNRLLQMWDPDSRFTVLLHAGGGFSHVSYGDLDPTEVSGNANTDRADNLAHFTGGIMPQYRLNERLSLFADFSLFGHVAQSYTWDGHWDLSEVPGGDGRIWNVSIGIVYDLKTARSRWNCRSVF